MKVEIWFKYSRRSKEWTCGIGDGVHGGMYARGATKAEAALKFINAYNKIEAKALNLTGTI